MTEPGERLDDEEDRNPIERIAAEFVERLRVGDQPTIDEYAALHPEMATEIHELLPTVIAMEELKLQKETPDKSRFLKGPASLKKLGDYLILNEIGRGGMGIVYEAEQQSLGRRVAVKVLPRQSLLDEHRLQRFEREAQTAARLHHTNIVPIFGVGEQDGYHYYVMQFIRGLGLDRIVRELRGEKPKSTPGTSSASLFVLARDAASGLLHGRFRGPTESTSSTSAPVAEPPTTSTDAPTSSSSASATVDSESAPLSDSSQPGPAYWRSVAKVGLQVADALSYAHSMNTLHRDIKPANLLLDEQGIVWVTDFGLAKVLEESNLTNTGDVVGTLQYMAPEQFYGEYDERSDLYCLGLTLYELLTLQPAFSGSNRSGLMHKVTEGRPTAPRHLRPGIPADLETIVLKSINREPHHRYSSAEEMRADLQRFIEDRPILARRANPAQLAWRWCRRNRALAAAVIVAVVGVLGATALGWTNYVLETSTSRELRSAEQQTQKTLARALETMGIVFDHVAGPDLFQPVIRDSAIPASEAGEIETFQDISTPIASKEDAKMLEAILGMYAEFASENHDHPELQQDIAHAKQKIGDIRMRLGELDKARGAYLAAIVQYRQLGEDEHAVTIAAIRNQLGQVYAQQHMVDTARQSHALVLDALEDEEGNPRLDSSQALYELARAHDSLGSFGRQLEGELPRVNRSPRSSRGRRGMRGMRRPGRRGNPRRGPLRAFTDPERRGHHVEAQRLIGTLLKREPNNVAFRLAMARSCRNYHGYLWPGRTSARREWKDRSLVQLLWSDAMRILRELSEEFPDAWLYQYELAETLIAGPQIADHIDRTEDALVIARRLRQTSPSVPSFAALQSRILRRLAGYQHDLDPDLAHDGLLDAVALLEDLVSGWPENWSYLRLLSRTRVPLVESLIGMGDLAGARDQALAVIREGERFLAKTQGPKQDYHGLVSDYLLLAKILRDLQLDDEADAALAEATRVRGLAGRPTRRR